ncbi:hypothetical protein HZH68_015704 [Vespula germanica]|uniref:Uncharacterized protein n=1 Tax=Vespula germanica TaxID=30212 RepID=A0A834J4H3_VESGE|nr:hypothetical protein HZH68_015704 [Vespula germanica]
MAKKSTHRGRKRVLIRKRSAEIADLWGSRNQMGYMAGLMSAKFRKKNFVGRKFPVLNENVLEERNCEVLTDLGRFFKKETWFTDIWCQRVIWRNPLGSSQNDNYQEGWQQYMSRSRDVPSELGVDKSFVDTRRFLIDNIEHLSIFNENSI